MIRVPENDLRFDVVFQFGHLHRFHTSRSAHRHKYGCFNLPVIGRDQSGARLRGGIGMLQFKFQNDTVIFVLPDYV
ncbi:hypothetical protein SDC9_84787 [bioreactor metagenome]|uniref:Uncharacterized protein n=1 Tax=bioreactor metagenome TaxID=1076179 RepID=A0A644ZB95_9ZZZZ